jgi:NADPH-dependent glutamate synthase beta subunit-like oxidoreductase
MVRVRSFAHNELGFTDAQAHAEAERCLRCHRPVLLATQP